MQTVNVLQIVGLLSVGSAIAIILIKFPQRFLEKLGEDISPNWLSVIHVPFVWLGYTLYSLGGIWLDIGFQLVVIGAILDRLDGKMAAILDKKYENVPRATPTTFWAAMSFKGSTDLGKTIDPAADKIAIAPIFLYVAYKLYLEACQHYIGANENRLLFITAIFIVGILFLDLLGTIIRIDAFKWLIRGTGATWAGKIKALCQWIWLICHMPYDQGWIVEYRYEYMILLNIFLAIVLLLGIISLVTKMVNWGDWITKLFKHHVE